MGVFTLFTTEPYTFLELDRQAEGMKVVSTSDAQGVFKLRDGMTRYDDLEAPTSDATIRIKPYEPFVGSLDGQLVGHGIRMARHGLPEQDYRIVGQTEGYDYDAQKLDFYLLELKREATWDGSQSPLV